MTQLNTTGDKSSVKNESFSSHGDYSFFKELKSEAFPLLHRIIDGGCVTSDNAKLISSFIDCIDLTWMTTDLQFLHSHRIELPRKGESLTVSGLNLSRRSPYFERLIYHSQSNLLKLPFSEFEFLERVFKQILFYINKRRLMITEDNCLDFYRSADFLLMEDLRCQSLEFINDICSKNLNAAINIWSECRSLFYPELTATVLNELLLNFEAVSQLPSWTYLHFEELKQLLQHNALNASSELKVYSSIRTWLLANWHHRRSQGEEALTCVRVGLLNELEIQNVLAEELLEYFPRFKSSVTQLGPARISGPELNAASGELLSPMYRSRDPHEAVFVFGGWCQEVGPKAACQVYNPRADVWSEWLPTSVLPVNHICQIERRVYAGCVVVDGVIHLVGGYDGRTALKSVACYDTRSCSGWYEGSCMLNKRYYVCCAVLNGCIYAIGGHTGDQNNGRLSSVEKLTVRENNWTQVASMQVVRSDAGAAALNGKIYVAGGFDGSNYHDSAEVYDPNSNQWSLISRMNSPRGGVALVAYGKMLYAIGGNDGSCRLAVVEKYENESEGWLFAGRLTRQKSNLSVSVVDKSILVIGGWSDEGQSGILSKIEKFDPHTETSREVANMCFPASATAACTIIGRDLVSHYLHANFSYNNRISDESVISGETPSTSMDSGSAENNDGA